MKLQQKIAMALCALYLISVIGVAMNMHFCSGKLSGVSFKKTAGCGACKSESKYAKNNNCCKDTSVEAKIKDSHKGEAKVNLPQDFSIELFFGPVVSELFKIVLPNTSGGSVNKAPPLSSIFSLHILNCVFRN